MCSVTSVNWVEARAKLTAYGVRANCACTVSAKMPALLAATTSSQAQPGQVHPAGVEHERQPLVVARLALGHVCDQVGPAGS